MFALGATLDEMTPSDVNGLDEAHRNAMELAGELLDILTISPEKARDFAAV
jgi:hypothetical protein